MKTWLALADRTAVLFVGVAAGTAIGYAFAGDRTVPTPAAVPIIAPPVSTAQPPLAGTSAQGQPARPVANPSSDTIAAPAPAPTAVPAPPAATASAAPAVPIVDATTPANACAAPAQPHLLHALAEGSRVRVGVFGDSFGDGVWSGLQRLLPAKQGYEVVKFSQQATGFTRYKSLNIEDHTAAQVAGAPVDIAVISFGANDTQGLIADGKLARLMTPAWQEVIGGRVARMVAMLRRQGAMVYWVGLPRMRKPAFDSDIANMNAFYERRMHDLCVPFIDTRPVSSGPDGFAPYLPDPATGKQTLMRAEDGIHMSMTGYVWITRGLAARIRSYVDSARTLAGPPPPATAPAANVATGA